MSNLPDGDILKEYPNFATVETSDKKLGVVSLRHMNSVTSLITECAECQDELPNPVLLIEIGIPDDEDEECIPHKSHVICDDCRKVLADNT